MKKSIALIALLALLAAALTGCVKIIDKGTESQYTGVEEFDAAADSSNDWDSIAAEISGKAADIASVLESSVGIATPVSGSGTISEFVSKANGKKNSLTIVPDGYAGDAVISMQIGSIYTGTAIRDAQTLKVFESFTNQTEWSQYAKALNAEMNAQVIEPLAIDAGAQGKRISFVAVASASGGEVLLTPVSITIE